MTEPPDVTVCVPVYNGAAFVAETLESIQRQTYGRCKTLVSVDRSDDDSLAVCQSWEGRGRFEVFGQEARLGWVENTNWLLRRVDTAYTCIVSHDDLIEPDYLGRLVARLRREPQAVLVYGDIHGFGTHDVRSVEPSLAGSPFERILDFLLNRTFGIAWHGVVRSIAVAETGLHRSDAGGFAADLLWLLELALRGELLREPGVVYYKRYVETSVTGGWRVRPPEQAATDWVDHCVACLDVVLGARGPTAAQRQQLVAAALARAMRFYHVAGHSAPAPPDLAALLVRLAHVTLRATGTLPDRSALPDEGAISPLLCSWLDTEVGRLVRSGSA